MIKKYCSFVTLYSDVGGGTVNFTIELIGVVLTVLGWCFFGKTVIRGRG